MAGTCSHYWQLHHHHHHRLRLRLPFPPPHQSSSSELKGWARRSRSITTLFNLSCSSNIVIINSHNADGSQQQAAAAGAGAGAKRRDVLLQGVFAAAGYGCSCSLSPIIITTPYNNNNSIALAAQQDTEDDAFRVYSDDVNKFKILIPPDWKVGSGEGDGIRSLTAFYPQETSNSNVSIVITGLGADFTRLESFGKVDAFAENLVSGLDRSWQRPPGVKAKLIDSKAANGLYYIEYTLQNPGESRRHLYSVLGIANNGWYNRLYTLTGQFIEEEADKYGSTIQKAVASFRLT